MGTYSNYVKYGITLTNTTQNPVTITSTGIIGYASHGVAVYGNNLAAWSILNEGKIVGGNFGVTLVGSGTVTNYGTISGSTGVHFGNGGVVTNKSGGLIASTGGIDIAGNIGTVTNDGTITASGNAPQVNLYSGGSVKNGATGLIYGGVLINGGPGVLTNAGTIIGLRSYGLSSNAAMIVTNGSAGATSAVIAGIGLASGTITNYGSIQGAGNSDAIQISGSVGTTIINIGAIQAAVGTGIYARSSPLYIKNGVLGSTIAVIAGPSGIRMGLGTGSIVNYGTIKGIGSNGISIGGNSSRITNSSGAVIAGNVAISLSGSFATVSNYGTIQGTAGGISLSAGGNVRNGASGATAALIQGGNSTGVSTAGTILNYGTIVGKYGVISTQTIVNSGSIIGSGGVAVQMSGGGNRLIVEPSAVFIGTVRGGGTGNVLELAPGAPGALSALGTSFTNFATVKVDQAASWQISGSSVSQPSVTNDGTITVGATSLSVGAVAADGGMSGGIRIAGSGFVEFQGPVAGSQGVTFVNAEGLAKLDDPAHFMGTLFNFVPGDVIELPNVPFHSSSAAALQPGNVLQINENGSIFSFQLDPAQDFSRDIFALSSGLSGDTLVSEQPLCFCRGTRVLAERGEVAVEDLAVGDRVVTLSGACKPIVWIGMGRDLVTRRNSLVRPIIVRAGALAENVPHRDLYLTHGHALYLDGALIPVEHLVNHRTIVWDEEARVVEYYHVELEDHDVLLAEGAPAESYHDANNRAVFQNTRPGSRTANRATGTVAPVLHAGDLVEAVWARLFTRAGGQLEREVTDDPDLHLVVDGQRLDPEVSDDGACRFAVAHPPAATLLLRSRTGVPSLLGHGRSDHRPLGVALAQIVIEQAGITTYLDYDQPQLREGGCYAHEDGFCWTDGDFHLPARFLPALAGPFTLTVLTEPHPDMRYPLAPRRAQAA